MSRTRKDKPFKFKNTATWPYGYSTRWNNCNIHEKLCSFGSSINKNKILNWRKARD